MAKKTEQVKQEQLEPGRVKVTAARDRIYGITAARERKEKAAKKAQE